jgi:hypothetical protein
MKHKASTQSQVWRRMIRFLFRNKNLSIQEERARSRTMARFHPPYPPGVELEYGSIPRNQVDAMPSAGMNPISHPVLIPLQSFHLCSSRLMTAVLQPKLPGQPAYQYSSRSDRVSGMSSMLSARPCLKQKQPMHRSGSSSICFLINNEYSPDLTYYDRVVSYDN